MRSFIYTYYVTEDSTSVKKCGIHIRWATHELQLSQILHDSSRAPNALLLWNKDLSRAQVVDLVGEEVTRKLEQDFMAGETRRSNETEATLEVVES